MLRKLLFSLLLSLAIAGQAAAQQAGPVGIQQSGSRLDACQSVAYVAGTAGTTSTATIPALSGNYAYICSITADVCANGTGATAITNGNFTSTNLPGSPTWQVSFGGAANTCPLVKPVNEQFYIPIKSLAPGTATTVVCPASMGAQNLCTIRVAFYYAP